jgi:NAD-dependent SIR2 family protein deacetylase
MHGRRGDPKWAAPTLTVESNLTARPGYATIKAHEYCEEPAVLQAKVKLLAWMIRASKCGIVYSGAGISTASGVPDYATQAAASQVITPTSPWHAQPTLAHRVLGELFKQKQLVRWFQQNHDGLPQKAGVPQHQLNEIHGSWWDPSNPVVKMSGQLRGDLFADVEAWEHSADLCLALGTSLAGMNADRLALSTAAAAQKGRGHGLVIIGVQQTQADDQTALRIFAKLDVVFSMLATEFGFAPTTATSPAAAADAAGDGAGGGVINNVLGMYTPAVPADAYARSVFSIPYDGEGNRLPAGADPTVLDLTEDVRVGLRAWLPN